MDYQSVMNIINSTRKGQFGINVVALISCDKKLLASSSYMRGRIQKLTLGSNIRLVSFGGKVEGKLNGDTYNVAAPKGFVWVCYPYVKQDIKSGVQYLTINYRECDERTKFESVYLLDGKVVDKRVVECHFKSSGNNYSQKQAAAGITDEREQTKVVQYELGGVHYLGTCKADAEEIFNNLQG
jgi:hypothetical protein